MTPEEAKATILTLIRESYLVGVEVFTGNTDHDDEDEDAGYGLSDMFGPWSVGSDCNAAEPYLMRPSRDLFDPDIHAALTDETYGVWTGDQTNSEFARLDAKNLGT